MTISITRDMTFAEIPAIQVRDRLVRLAFHDWFTLHAVIDEFRIDLNQARALMAALVRAGFYTKKLSKYYITDQGRSFLRASAAPRVHRKTAKNALESVLERATAVNSNDQYFCRIERIAVFGSYLGSKDRLGDLDLAVQLKPRDPNHSDHISRAQYCDASGRPLRNLSSYYAWPELEVYGLLKNRKRTIRIVGWSELQQLLAEDPELKYEIVFGNKSI
jgi:hypothetical protein